MKYFVVILGVLAVLALTQAQNESDQAKPSEPNSPPSSGESRAERPGRPNIHQQSGNENREDNNPPRRFPQRQPVFFDFNFGKDNKIYGERKTTTTTTTAVYD